MKYPCVTTLPPIIKGKEWVSSQLPAMIVKAQQELEEATVPEEGGLRVQTAFL
jgi:hypothetical protein